MKKTMTSRRRLRALAAGVVMSALGCGYGFSAGAGLATVAAGRPVALARFENRSLEADAALLAGRAAARALAARGASGAGAAVLSGVVDGVQSTPVGVLGPQNVAVWRTEVRLRLELRDGDRPDARLLAKSAVVATEDFRSGTDVEATEVSRRLALQRLVERAVVEALDRLAP